MQLIRDRVFVIPDEIVNKTSTGILLAESLNDQKPVTGKVVAVGPGLPGNPMEIKVGQTATYTKGIGEFAIVNGEKYLVLTEEMILATN